MIEFKDVGFSYEDKEVFKALNFSIPKSQKVVLLGSNGSGKSTLLRLLGGLYFVDRGEYRFDGKVIDKKSVDKDFRKRVGILFQNPESMIFNPTLKDEIAFSLREFGFDEVEKRVSKIAKEFGLLDKLSSNPLSLSGGEKQKMMLGALLAYEPELLLLDEPTASMDPKSTGWFIDMMIELDKTVVLATHDLSLAYEVSDRAIVLDQNHQKIYDGQMDALVEDLELLESANLIHKHKHKHRDFYHSHYHLHFK